MKMKAEERMSRRQLAGMLRDPVNFARAYLRHKTWGTQEKILRAVRDNSRVAVKSCHGASKTFTAAELTLWWISRYDDGIVLTTSPTGRQVESLLWGELRKTVLNQNPPPRMQFPEPNLSELKISEGNYALGFSTSSENAGVNLQGFHGAHLLIIVDEALGVEGPIWDAIEGARAGGDVKVVLLCNPTIPSGLVYHAFTTDRLRWQCMTIDAFDTPNLEGFTIEMLRALPDDLAEDAPIFAYKPWPMLVTRYWVYEQYHKHGEDSPFWQSRVRGQFPEQAEDSMYPLSWLERAKDAPEAILSEDEVVIGIDVAGPGKDETVCAVRARDSLIAYKAWSTPDPRGEVLEFLRPYKTGKTRLGRPRIRLVNIDATGIGYGFALSMIDEDLPVNFINFGDAATTSDFETEMQFANRKAELYWRSRECLRQNRMHGLDDELIAQATQIRYLIDPKGRVSVEKKELMKKRGVPSPDKWEALIMAFDLSFESIADSAVTIPRHSEAYARLQRAPKIATIGSRWSNTRGAW